MSHAAIRSYITNFVLTLALIALLATNVMSLVSQGFHQSAYGLLAMAVGTAAMSHLLANSPTAKANRLADANR